LDECVEVNLQSRNSTVEKHYIGYCKENRRKVGESRIFYTKLFVIRVVEDEHDCNQCILFLECKGV
jgi:hypothetical protein